MALLENGLQTRYLQASGVTPAANGVTNVAVPLVAIQAGASIILTINTPAGTAGPVSVTSITAGTGFSVKAGTAGDTSTYNYVVYNLQ